VNAPRLVVMCGVYNEEAYLDETIPSILGQSMHDFTLLLMDNGSTDATWEILKEYATLDGRIRLARNTENLWGPVAMNHGMARAQIAEPDARWFLPHGADDVMLPGYLQAVCDAAAMNPHANCIYSPWSYIDGVLPDKRFPRFDPETCHAEHQMPAWRAITRELWDLVGPENESIRIGSDWEWPVRARHVLNAVQLDRPYLALRVRTGVRKSQSEEVNWPALHRHLCQLAGKPVPRWAQ
jgi:glycosyltransferase involved in cell wall biosynthesis